MTDKPCKECAHYRLVPRRGYFLETCGDNGRSIAFARAEYGVWGEPHCGPEGKLFINSHTARVA